MADLIERLTDIADALKHDGDRMWAKDVQEAATELARQAEEITFLRQTIARLEKK